MHELHMTFNLRRSSYQLGIRLESAGLILPPPAALKVLKGQYAI